MSAAGALPLERPATAAGSASHATPEQAAATPVAAKFDLGLPALQAAAYVKVDAYPLDVRGAQTDGKIGYLLEQELANRLPATRAVTTLITRVEVDPHDPAFRHPTKPIGPIHSKTESERIATDVAAVFLDWGGPTQRAIGKVTPQALAGHEFAAGSTGPKVQAARAFVVATGRRAVIGSLDRIEEMISGTAGTQVCTAAAGGADAL